MRVLGVVAVALLVVGLAALLVVGFQEGRARTRLMDRCEEVLRGR
jgi:hypothetical protein